MTDVRYLCKPALSGRRAGTVGARKASVYIAGRFRSAGLRPGGSAGGYFQTFKIRAGFTIESRLSAALGKTPLGKFERGHDYSVVHVPGGSADLRAPCVLAGYGIASERLRLNEYTDLDARGTVVIVFGGVPSRKAWLRDPTLRKELLQAADFGVKARAAAARGAVALVIADNPAGWRYDLEAGDYLRLPDSTTPLDSPIPVVQMTRSAVARLTSLPLADLHRLALEVAAEGAPNSQALRGRTVELAAKVSGTARTGRNVIGVRPGAGDLRRQAVVVGAHYDHLGEDEETIFFGANDNAAGVGALLAVARALGKVADAPRRTVICIAFAAEEIGKRGSKHYVRHPLLPMDDTVLMINFDMIGRNEPAGIFAVGTRSSPELHRLHQRHAARVGLTAVHPESYRLGLSDHTAFYEAGAPIMYLFGGRDPDYNTPEDTPDKLIPAKIEKVARLAFLTVHDAATRPKRLTFAPRPDGDWWTERGPHR